MKLYFKVNNNVVDNSLVYNENELLELFSSHNFEISPPPGYVLYIPGKVNRSLRPYEKISITGYTYENDTTISEQIEIISMTEEEKKIKQEETKINFYNKHKFYSWKLNEEHCMMLPPYPPPNDEYFYMWNEQTQTHVRTEMKKADVLKYGNITF